MSSKKYTKQRRTCSIDGCERVREYYGLCQTHWRRMKRHGTTAPQLKAHGRTLEERFWSFVQQGQSSECWVWIGTRHKFGYGKISERRGNIRHDIGAHRLSWEIHRGHIPPGMFVCHHCDNPPCVNPEHLFLGSNRDNMVDMMRKGKAKTKLVAADIPVIRALYDSGHILQREIGEMYGVSGRHISSIIAKKKWGHI